MNLLPPYQREIIHEEIITRLLFVVGGIMFFLSLIFLVLMYNVLLYINLQIPALEGRLVAEQKTQKANLVELVEGDIGELNSALVSIDKIRKKESFNFPYILRVIGSLMPEGTQMKSITYQGGNLAISGHADERSGVLKLKENLEKAKVFKNINSPLSNIIKERDIVFSFNFSIDGQ
ncbi:MAG: PilN domain-containing protein [Candidatus Spechtbacterales bacterium]